MSSSTAASLTRTDAACLSAAARQHQGQLVLPETMTPLASKRLLGRLLKQGLIEPREVAGATAHAVTPTGYKAVGLTPPTSPVSSPAHDAAASKAASKRERVLGLLGRIEGASLAELIAATGWLPHTTRAALSRIRSGGQVLAKTQREDGATTYRIVPEEPAPGRRNGAGSARHTIAKPQASAA